MITATKGTTIDKKDLFLMSILKIVTMVLIAAGLFVSTLCWCYLFDLFQPINDFFGLPENSLKITASFCAITSVCTAYILVNLKWNIPS